MLRASAWRDIGASEHACRAIRFGIYEAPTVPFTDGRISPPIPQSEEDLAFGLADLEEGCRTGVYQNVPLEEVRDLTSKGLPVASAFVTWKETSEGPVGRFVIDFAEQSMHWPKGTIRMETLAEFGLSLEEGDHMFSWDIKSGYRHFRLAPSMRDFFLFRYHGHFYRCVALPFGWGRSPLWFTELLRPFVQYLRRSGLRVLAYLDDFLALPGVSGAVASQRACHQAREFVSNVMGRLGLTRHPTKGHWEGSTRVSHLGVTIDTQQMRFYIEERKVTKIRAMAKMILQQARRGRRWVSRARLQSFAGTCVALTLAMPFARFYTRSLYDSMAAKRNRGDEVPACRGGSRVRLSHQALRDLEVWRALSPTLGDGRDIRPQPFDGIMHSDAAEVGYGGTLSPNGQPGDPGLWEAQAIWSYRDREDCISVRELRAVRLLLQGYIGRQSQVAGMHSLRVCVDNTAVVSAIRSFASASTPMMRELRRLKVVLSRAGLHIRPEWLPSAANRFADALSRRFPAGDLRIRSQLVRSVAGGLRAGIRLRYARTLGSHPVYARRLALQELRRPWNQSEAQVLFPPVDLAAATVSRIRRARQPAILLLPDWSGQRWHVEATALVNAGAGFSFLPSETGAAAFRGQRRVNPQWSVRVFVLYMPRPTPTW